MKAIVLMGISCLMLAGVYGVMGKQSTVSKILSFNQENSAVSPTGALNQEKASSAADTTAKKSSKTLDDSHWIDDPLFEKAAGTDLVTGEGLSETTTGQPKAAAANKRSTPKKGQEPVTTPAPEVKQLILELDPDSTAPNKKIPTIAV